MTVVVTRNAPERYRGFLASCMLEVAPGVYTSPRMSDGVRKRIWEVCSGWSGALPEDGGILLTWRDTDSPSGQRILTLGWPRCDIIDYDGVWFGRRGDEMDVGPDRPDARREGPDDMLALGNDVA